MKIMLVAGEASGDVHGAALARALKARRPEVELFGLGGGKMAEEGVRLLWDPTRVSIIGIVEALKKYPLFRHWQAEVKRALREERPDAVVLIDFGGFNLGVAAYAHRLGIPAVYYICPAAWAYGRGRARRVAESCTRVASVFPFEADVYREAGANVTFVGNPLLDVVRPSRPRAEVRRDLGASEEELLVGLLPGSRRQEVEHLLPVMLSAGRRLAAHHADLRWALGLAPTVDRAWVEAAVHDSGLPVALWPAAHDVMQGADVLMAASGTATLEAAIFGTPMVVVYRVSPLTYLIGRRLVKLPHIALPNIVAGEEVAPELVQDALTPESLATAVERYLVDPGLREAARSRLRGAVARLGEPGAAGRAAGLVLEAAGKGQGRRTGGEA